MPLVEIINNKIKPRARVFNSVWGMAIAGAFFALSSPGYNLWFLAWVGLMPWLGVEKENSWRQWVLKSFVFGAFYHGITMLWLLSPHPLHWIGLNTLTSMIAVGLGLLLIMMAGGVLFSLLGLAYRLLSKVPYAWVLFPVLWVLAFSYYDVIQIWVPWARIELSQMAMTPYWAYYSEKLEGIVPFYQFVAFVLVFHNVWGLQQFQQYFQKPSAERLPLLTPSFKKVAYALLILLPVVSYFITPPRFASYDGMTGFLKTETRVVQGNIPIENIRDTQSAMDWAERVYLTPLDREAKTSLYNKILIYPEEGLIPGEVTEEAPEENAVVQRLSAFVGQSQQAIIAGTVVYSQKERKTYNSLLLVSPNKTGGVQYRFYHKQKLVPFGEYTPWIDGQWLADRLQQMQVDYTTGFDTPYYKTMEEALLPVGSYLVGPLVCFELIYPEMGVAYAKADASWLVNSSNLGWFHHNRLMDAQFIAHGQMMAMTTRLPVVIANNVGRSGIISREGVFIQTTAINKQNTNPEQPNYQDFKSMLN